MQLNTSECLANLINEEAAFTVTSDTGHLTGVDILFVLMLPQGTHPALFHCGGALVLRDMQAQVPLQTEPTSHVCQGLSGKLRSTDCLGRLLIFPAGDVQEMMAMACLPEALALGVIVCSPVDAVQTNISI